MFNIIGLSHLVFTVNNKEFKDSNYLKDRFSNPENFIFDHYQFKNSLLRNPNNKFSKITLYKSSENNFPAIEFINSENSNYRPKDSYGIIDKSYVKAESFSTKIQFSNNNYIHTYFCPKLNLNICNKTDVISNNVGLWMKVFNFKQQVEFFKKNLKLNCYYEDNYKANFSTRIVNKSFSNFDIVIFKSSKKQSFFNDDIGLSTIGWITKNLVYKTFLDGFHLTEPFKIKLAKNEFQAQFSYNNTFISNEYLKINYERNKI